MKRRFFLPRLKAIVASGFILSALVFSSCKKTVDSNVHTPAAGLMAFNLAPDKQVAISLSGTSITSAPLVYTNYTGGYLGVVTGNRDIASYDYSSGTLLATTSQLFIDSAYYSTFIVGANGKYRNIVVKDGLAELSSSNGEAFVRYVNAIADTTKQPLVTVSSNGATIFNSPAPFAFVSGFKAVTPGNVAVAVSAESAINSSRIITLEAGKIYTVLLVGLPAQTDTTKSVQIKFIQNGSIQ